MILFNKSPSMQHINNLAGENRNDIILFLKPHFKELHSHYTRPCFTASVFKNSHNQILEDPIGDKIRQKKQYSIPLNQ